MNRRRLLSLWTALLGALSLPTRAGAQAARAFFERDGVALRGYDPMAYFTEGKPVKGLAQHRAEHAGAVFHFANARHRDAFVAEPAKYAPQYGGYCAFGMASGYKAATDPTVFSIVEGKLYLNYNAAVQRQWSTDIPGFIAKAERQWPSVQAHTKVHE